MDEKRNSSTPQKIELGKFILLDKQGIKRLLSQFKSEVKTRDEILPFLDRYFESLRVLNLGVK